MKQQSRTKTRKNLEDEIILIRQQIVRTRQAGGNIDELCKKLAILQSDLSSLALPYRPGWISRTQIIGA